MRPMRLPAVEGVIFEQLNDAGNFLPAYERQGILEHDPFVTLDVEGARTINMRSAANDRQCITVAATITASGRRVESMIVFKGKF